MKILLSTSPHIKHSAVLESDFVPRNDLMYNFAPLCLLMLCAVLREKNRETPFIFDINHNINNGVIKNDDTFYDSAASAICKECPDVLGFMTECDSYHHVLQICKKVKALHPECYIILGGPHATAVADKTMERWECIDCIVLGEGEVTFVELILQLETKNTRDPIAGTIRRNANGEIIKGTNRSLIDSLDTLPFPAYDLYTSVAGEELFVEVGRGCPFHCTFCSTSPFWQRKHRVKSPQRIVAELAYISQSHLLNRVHFTHDLFTTNEAWVRAVCKALIQAKNTIKWTCSSRIDTISEDLIQLMSAAGCNAIYFGVESGSERILQLIEKKIPFSDTLNIISLCNKYNIIPNAGLILGFPFEDDKSLSDTFIAYLQMIKAGARPIHLFSLCPFAQSSLYGSLREMECTGHFLDIPLSKTLDKKNRELVAGDNELFGSYFKPVLADIPRLQSKMLTAVDEFSILVDSLRLASVKIAEKIGGMKELFFQWISYISHKNEQAGLAEFRKYFGSPVDFCNFLLTLITEHAELFESYIESLVSVAKKNFEISSRLSWMPPVSMATYRSKVIPKSLTEIDFSSRINAGDIIDTLQIDYDITGWLYTSEIPETISPAKQKINLVWQRTGNGNISLITVNDFIYHIIISASERVFSVEKAITDWMAHPKHDPTALNISELLKDVEAACEKELLTLND